MPLVRRVKLAVLGVAAATLVVTGCVFRTAKIDRVDPKGTSIVETSVKAHLLDGTTIIYPTGFVVRDNTVVTRGSAHRYALGSNVPTAAGPIPLDSVVGMESFGVQNHVAKSVVVSTIGIVGGAAAGIVLLKALFGSCPTFYADSAGTELLQGEGFSYAIAPMFEQRDVDRLRIIDAHDGRITLRVRNEALETHYINHLELVEIDRRADELAVGDNSGRPLLVRNVTVPSMRDRAGRNVTTIMAALDNNAYSTEESVIRNVTSSDLRDYIDLEVPAGKDVDSVAIVLDMRNSLLNTVLLYENILGAPGARSLDFLAKDMSRLGTAVEMGRWYAANMGMRVSVMDNGEYRQVARLGDTGPIAYHKVGVVIPAITGANGKIKVRLSFVADDWRIDGIAVTSDFRRPGFKLVHASRVTMADPQQNAASLAALEDPDESYVITGPGQAFSVEFDVGQSTSARSWLLASQGYYTEWVRGSWIKSASGKAFTADNSSLATAVASWHSQRTDMERRFYETRIQAR